MTFEEEEVERGYATRIWGKVFLLIGGVFIALLYLATRAFASADVYSAIPKKFDHLPEISPLVYFVLLHSNTLEDCRFGVIGTIVSCRGQVVSTGQCIIFIAKGLSPRLYRAALRHEHANCNGWNDGKEK